jgi:transcriptional regulator with XRE-family HTH domain
MNTFGRRLFEERHRLQRSQAELAQAIGVSERSIGNYERGQRSPDAEQLVRLVEQGMDVYYVLTGKRASGRLDLEPMQRAVLDDFDRCSHEKQIEAVRYMALLAEGVTAAVPAKQVRKNRPRDVASKNKKSN